MENLGTLTKMNLTVTSNNLAQNKFFRRLLKYYCCHTQSESTV